MMIFILLFTVIIALVLQKVTMARSLDPIIGDHSPEKRVLEPDEVVRIKVTLRNEGRRSVPFLRVREDFEHPIKPHAAPGIMTYNYLKGGYGEFTTWLRPRQMVTRYVPISISERGLYVLPQFTVHGGDFLGLQEHSKQYGRFNEVVVAPRETMTPKLIDVFGGFMGEVSVNRFIMEDPVLTLGYREYSGREPMKMISWTQSAKRGQLMVKKTDYTLQPTVSVVLNTATSLTGKEKAEMLEETFRLTRTVCSMLERKGVKYNFVSNAILAGSSSVLSVSDEGLGNRHFGGILEYLGRATYGATLSLETLLDKEARRQTSTGKILITPDGEGLHGKAMARFREAANGNLLVLNAQEVKAWS